jgi:hypothetical protein
VRARRTHPLEARCHCSEWQNKGTRRSGKPIVAIRSNFADTVPMNADRYIAYARRMQLVLFILVASTTLISANQIWKAILAQKALSMYFLKSVYRAASQFESAEHATNKDISVIIHGELAAAMIAMIGEQARSDEEWSKTLSELRKQQLHIEEIPVAGYYAKLPFIFRIGPIKSRFALFGVCSAVAIQGPSDVQEIPGRIIHPEDDMGSDLHYNDLFLINFAMGCNIMGSILLIREYPFENRWVLAIRERTFSEVSPLAAILGNFVTRGVITLNRNVMLQNIDPVFWSFIKSDDKYVIISQNLADSILMYYASRLTSQN